MPHIVSRLHHKYLNSGRDMCVGMHFYHTVLSLESENINFLPWDELAFMKHPISSTTAFCTDGSIMQALGKYAGSIVFNLWFEPHVNPSGGRRRVCTIWPDSRSSLASYSCISINRMQYLLWHYGNVAVLDNWKNLPPLFHLQPVARP